MRLKALILGTALLTFGAGAAGAGTTWLGLNGGAGIPTGDYGDAATTGWHVGGTGTHSINQQFAIGGDIVYHAWGASDDLNDAAEALFGPGSEFSWSALQATAHGRLNIPTHGMTQPYVQFGMGIYNITSKLDSPSGDDSASESEFGFNFGGGMNFMANGNTRWGVSALYHLIPAEDDFGADLNFFTLGAQYMWGMGNK